MFKHRIDLSLKHITFDLDEKSYLVHFRSGFFRGVYDVQVFIGAKDVMLLHESDAKIKSTYPNLAKRIKESALLIKSCLGKKVNEPSPDSDSNV